MLIQALSHTVHCPLPDNSLEIVNCQFQSTGGSDGEEINTAIDDETVNISQGNGIVDYPFLHFERDYSGKNNEDDYRQQDQLQLYIASEDPVKEGSFSYRC